MGRVRSGHFREDLLSETVGEGTTAHLENEASVLIQQGIKQLLQSSPGNLLSDIERFVITEAYHQSAGNQVHAAHLLGITRSMLRVRLKRYGMI